MFYFGNIVIGIIFVSPLIWMVSASLKPEAKIFANMDSLMTFLPTQASLANYAEVFSRLNMPLVFKNTLLYIGLILVLDLLVNSMCGYALAKFEFKGKGAILNLVIALMVLPMEAIMLPLYIETVSYTHLDVYKRQGNGRASGTYCIHQIWFRNFCTGSLCAC